MCFAANKEQSCDLNKLLTHSPNNRALHSTSAYMRLRAEEIPNSWRSLSVCASVRYNCLSPGMWAHCGVTCMSCGEKKHSQSHKQLKLKFTSKSGAFLNPNSVLIIALSSLVNYIKRCDFIRARTIGNFLLTDHDQQTMCFELHCIETLSSSLLLCDILN